MHDPPVRPRCVRVAALQLVAHDRNEFQHVWPGILASIDKATSQGAQLLVLPEGTVPGYVLGNQPVNVAQVQAAVDDVQERARRAQCVIAFGAARVHHRKTFNSAYVVNSDGEIAGVADKHFLWHFDRKWFEAGSTLQPVQTSLGSLGVMICADGRIPLVADRLVSAGAAILVMPTAWVTSGRDPTDLENIQADLLASVRARENNVPFVAANKVGVEAQCVAYCGKSQIIERDGSRVALASQHRPEILSAALAIHTALPQATLHGDYPPQQRGSKATLRIALVTDPEHLGNSLSSILENTDADMVVGPGELGRASLERRGVGAAFVGDDKVLSPTGLIAYKEAGYQLIVWETQYESLWQIRFARTRALELRLYVIALDTARDRAYAVGPDGTVVCGTFDGYRVAAFSFNGVRTSETLVAPHTDIMDGLSRAALSSRNAIGESRL